MKIAFITSRFPYPVEKGDKLRAFQQLRGLSAMHEVHLFALSHDPVKEEDLHTLEEYCASVRVYRIPRLTLPFSLLFGLLDGLPAQVAYFLNRRIRRQMQEDLARLQPDHIYTQLVRTAEYVRILPVPKTLDYMDVFSVGAGQRASSGNRLLRPLYALEQKRLQKYERDVYADFTHHVIISEQDRDRLPLPYRGNVVVIPNGVDFEFYTPERNAQKRYDILFVGNMGYRPNIEAAEFLVRQVMPDIWAKDPEVRVCLAGARPHPRVLRLREHRVEVTGWVDDIRPYYDQSGVFIAPMFSGMGQQNKILEAMSMEMPCITTEIVDRAIGAHAQETLRIAGDARTFAKEFHALQSEPGRAVEMGRSAREFVRSHYDWSAQNKRLGLLLSSGSNVKSERTEV